MKRSLPVLLLFLALTDAAGQTCSIISKANNITPDKLCSPVSVVWNVSYSGVSNAGTPVEIRFDWNNGFVETVTATQTSPGVFQASSSNIYTSTGDLCNYHPQAMLIVNGMLCTSSAQEQIVTVWDDDDSNGGYMNINPVIYPICFGNGDNVRFQDLTQFNCVPPQERDNPNVNTRWIQWIYGTDITMTGIPVTINGTPRAFPYRGAVITLPGPVTGSGVWSEVMNVANDKLVGQHFEVTLRNWNYCNPYDDPNIPGPPHDLINGDHAPVETTARILIVAYPDATINPIAPLCANDPSVGLTAHDPGGNWFGNGVRGDRFVPAIAGPGTHTIRYEVMNAEGCVDTDTETITVYPVPDATIQPVGLLCYTDPPITLHSNSPGGVWSGPGVSGSTFSPSVSGYGNHIITYKITDINGCSDTDATTITVATPDATINPIDTMCVNSSPLRLTAHDLGGVWSGPGVAGDIFNPAIAGAGDHMITYFLSNPACQDSDTVMIHVEPFPDVQINNIGIQFINGPVVPLSAFPAGGIFSGTGVTGNTFNPTTAGLGTHIISYATIPDRYGCMGEDTIHVTVTMPLPPVAGFQPDTLGCTPLTVRFRNTSLYGESYIWGFGDGQYSTETNPEHTYYVPGSYVVKLIVYNAAGEATRTGLVTAYQNPSAIFEAYPIDVVNNEQVVVFSNSSIHGTNYLWDFGDGETSYEESPYHKYETEGEYHVTLVVTSKDGCIDTATMNTPVKVHWKKGTIRFPNVFKWNETGPTGGYWRQGVYPDMDKVFRPFFENVVDYRLQIFNRWGTLIYESNDLYKGWDGYFGENKLAVQGVYVWKVTGKYADGNYFDIVGDVTFLH